MENLGKDSSFAQMSIELDELLSTIGSEEENPPDSQCSTENPELEVENRQENPLIEIPENTDKSINISESNPEALAMKSSDLIETESKEEEVVLDKATDADPVEIIHEESEELKENLEENQSPDKANDSSKESEASVELSDEKILDSPQPEPEDSTEVVTPIVDSVTEGTSKNLPELNAEAIDTSESDLNKNDAKKPEETAEEPASEPIAKDILSSAVEADLKPAEDLINILKSLSPEKLKEIRSQIFDDSTSTTNDTPAMEVDASAAASVPEAPQESPHESQVKEPEKQPADDDDDDDCVILLDSDEEEAAPVVEKAPTPKPEEPPMQAASVKRKFNEGKENKPKKRLKDCVNPDCSGDSNEFNECPPFVMSFYHHNKKSFNVPFVCNSCIDKAVLKFEELGEALLNHQPLFGVELYKKKDMVEIIDSDDEEEQKKTKSTPVPDSEKIVFNEEVEMDVENILQDLCSRFELEKQKMWDDKDIKKRLDNLEASQASYDEELRLLEKKSSTMYNELYSINKPRIQRRPSLNITHEVEHKIEIKRDEVPAPTIRPAVLKKIEERPQAIVMKQALNPASLVVKPGQPAQRFVQKFVISPAQGQRVIAKPSPQQFQVITPLSKLLNDEIFIAVRSRAVKTNAMPNWMPCKLLDTKLAPDGSKICHVQFLDNKPNNITYVKGKEFALNVKNDKLRIGARVITFKTKDGVTKYLPGVIGERLSKYNAQRYLVFCDNGQVHYAPPDSVREISERSTEVWKDVHENLSLFIKEYLQSQTQRQRALLNVRMGQRVPTERNGNWTNATVVGVDCSVVKMFFQNENASEWLYRGSKRLAPLYSREGPRGVSTSARRNDPNITFIQIDDDDEQQVAEQPPEPQEMKQVARKSTAPQPQQKPAATTQQPASAQTPAKVIILNDSLVYLEDPIKVTKHKNFTPRAGIAAKRFVAHSCSPACLSKQNSNLANYSPLTKPLLTCWERLIIRQKQNRWVMYKAPCGRRLRNMYEIRRYLILTRSPLNVENYDFDNSMQVLHAYDVADKNLCPYYHPDMADGKEGMKIPIINPFDDRQPPQLEYSAVRIPMKGVNINTDPEFMACCDCTDDCADKSKCACFQLTISGHKFANSEDVADDDVSYVWKRLLNPVGTGIYECHSRCACSSRCLNKVAQQPIQIKMHLMRTKNRGWGLECLHDIPKGTFICIYAGRLHTEADANALCQGLDHGDEYFAELDLIETATSLKEGYEPGVVHGDDSDSDEDKASDSDSDYDARSGQEDGDFVGTSRSTGNRGILTRSARGEKSKSRTEAKEGNSLNNSDSDSEMVSMVPNMTGKVRYSLRKLFGPKEAVYIMDAKQCGNVGRYFNHSCDPNLFVQSVFVDTHDMRFPWIAFFANKAIKAGDELTWNYNYEVGSVASKVLYCKCGAKNCRGRIL